MTNKVNIFDVLNKINEKDYQVYANLTDEERKSVPPFVVMRWLTGTTDARQIYFLNELVNTMVFSLPNHPILLGTLMAISSSGKRRRYKWIKPKTTKGASKSKTVAMIREYFGYSSQQAADVLSILSREDIVQIAEDLGYQPEEIKAIKQENK